jgi:hypothetical protein
MGRRGPVWSGSGRGQTTGCGDRGYYLRVLENAGYFLTKSEPVSFPWKTLPYGVTFLVDKLAISHVNCCLLNDAAASIDYKRKR